MANRNTNIVALLIIVSLTSGTVAQGNKDSLLGVENNRQLTIEDATFRRSRSLDHLKGNALSRDLLQTNPGAEEEFECALTNRQISNILTERTRTWLVDPAALDGVQDDLQAIVDCSEEDDVILLDITENVQLARRVVLRWNLTISGVVRNVDIRNGIFPEAQSKQRLACPREDEGAFLIRARDVTLANLVFENCRLEDEEETSAIVEVEQCSSRRITGNVRLHHVEFTGNRLRGSSALRMNPESCSVLELVDVQFENNACSGFCGVFLAPQNNLSNVRLRRNRQIGEVSFIPTIIYAPPDSRTEALGIVALDNEGAVLSVDGGRLDISDSAFVRNEGAVNQDGDRYGANIHLEGATSTVRNCSFEDNSALRGSGIYASRSSLRIRNSTFERNVAEEGGAAVYLFRCGEVVIAGCTFLDNSLPLLDGAAVLADATTTLALRRSRFERNRAATGGAVHVVGGPLEIEGCQFTSNNASVNAGALYFEGTVIDFRRSILFNNSASGSGGAVFVNRSEEATIFNLSCLNSAAERGGCLRVHDTPLSLISSVFRANSAGDGGGLSVDGNLANISNCVFEENSAEYGGGMDLEVSETANITGSLFARNFGTRSGAGAFLQSGRFNVDDCTFEENESEQFGGGFTCFGNEAVLTMNRSLLRGNVAGSRGGGSVLISGCLGLFFNTTWTSNAVADGRGAGVAVEGGSGFFTDSAFERNAAQWGAAVNVQNSQGTFTGTVFRNNNATSAGGAMRGFNATVSIADCSAEGNEALHGGALFFGSESSVAIQALHAVSNNARGDGGSLGLHECTASISDSVFDRSFAADSGGAVDVTTSRATFLNITVFNCSAGVSGGGISAFTDSAVNITDSVFRQNFAQVRGGALVISRGSHSLSNTSLVSSQSENRGGGIHLADAVLEISECDISNNFAREEGGGILVWSSVLNVASSTIHGNAADNGGGGIEFYEGSNVFQLIDTAFTQNRGTFGGALAVNADSAGRLIEAYAFNNSASRNGGFAFVRFSNLTIIGGQFIESEAQFGGHIFLYSGQLDIQGTEFRNGTAVERGGSLAVAGESVIVVQNSTMSASNAGDGGALSLLESYFWGRDLRILNSRAEADGAAIFANESSSVLCVGCIFEGNFALSRGGAVYVESSMTQLLAFQFDNCTFENNSAALGGALHLLNEDRLANCSEPNANCTFLALRGSTFVGNDASTAGGAILSSSLDGIRRSCSYEAQDGDLVYLNRLQFESLPVLDSHQMICRSWERNTASVYGPTLASYARRVRKVLRFEEQEEDQTVEGNVYLLANHLSGSQIPSLFLTVIDELGQGPAIGSGNETVEATMWSPDRLFTGSLLLRLQDGEGNFSGIAGYREPGFYEVRVDFREANIPSFTIFIQVRRCKIGEAAVANGTVCQRCNGNVYNFFPDREDPGCVACPEDANCDTAVIRPRKGHWHSSPCSHHIQECLTKRACDDFERDERLEEIGSSVQDCDLSAAFLEDYEYALCRKGYRGPLCGSCESDFGRSQSFRCEPCFRGFANFVLVLLSIIVLLVLSGFTIRSGVPSERKPRRAEQNQRAFSAPSVTTRRSSSSAIRPANSPIGGMSHMRHQAQEIMAESRQRLPQISQSQHSNVEITKWKAVEIFKIAVNYLQIVGVATAVNVNWTDTLVGLFETAEFLGGVTSEAATRSVDCLISSDSAIPRAAVRTVVNIMVPMLVTALYFISWACALIKLQETVDYLLKRYILSFMAVSYLSYIALTKTAANALSCIDVHVWAGLEADQTTRYWAMDTSLECYKDSHAVLAAMIGWPILIVFSFGFPVAVATALLLERNKHGMQNPWLFEATGFMYRAYKNDYVFWESIVMLRKAALAVIVVFSYSLGGNLQGVMSVCVLVIALYFQIVCCPFRKEFQDLNNYEGLSLLVSSLTFVSGLFFNDDRISHTSRILLTILLVVANVGIFLFFFAVFWKRSAEYLRCLLGAEGVECNPEWGAFRVVKKYIFTRVREYSELPFRRKRTPTPSLLGVDT